MKLNSYKLLWKLKTLLDFSIEDRLFLARVNNVFFQISVIFYVWAYTYFFTRLQLLANRQKIAKNHNFISHRTRKIQDILLHSICFLLIDFKSMSTADNKDNIPVAYAVPDPNAAPINQYANQQQPSYNNMNAAPQQQQPYYPPPPQYQQQQPQQGNNYMGNMDDSQKGGMAGFLMGCVTCLVCFPLLFVPKVSSK